MTVGRMYFPRLPPCWPALV